ncbi:type IV secretion protein Rhs [Psychrobacter sp. CAL346-MNA-CIBAN-0220]|uniref:type IV secretion protein Rhs n=1 Tax=Psychrobacter sp. CAL346-MNA-CIBAN-0220 TaxID=3140457 RepID=UPI00332A0909
MLRPAIKNSLVKNILSKKGLIQKRYFLFFRGDLQQARPLSAGEIILARSVFGSNIQLDKVQLKTTWWVLKNYAVSPNGNIYFNPADWVVDFSEVAVTKQSWLIHELTHIWQLQQGLKVVRGALINRRYSYVLIAGKSFFKYGIEQQARMVQDYFVQQQSGKDCRAFEACIPFLQVPLTANTQSDNSSLTV